nr:MAG TPA: hypothetical protein [Caudoviricetes sp.]
MLHLLHLKYKIQYVFAHFCILHNFRAKLQNS